MDSGTAIGNVLRAVYAIKVPSGADFYWTQREFGKILKRNGLRLVWIDGDRPVKTDFVHAFSPSCPVWIRRLFVRLKWVHIHE